MNRPELEKYRGSASRHTCPACGRAKKFTRYIDSETGRYIADNVGRCDRESSCGYHYTPKEYFGDEPGGQNVLKMSSFKEIPKQAAIKKNELQANYEARFSSKKPDLIKSDVLLRTLTNYDQNSFVQFLLGLFPFDPEDVWQAVKDYLIGTTKDGKTIFWQVDQNRKARTGKIIAYSPETGKRQKDINPNWMHSELKKANLLKSDFELQQCFFGEHLLKSNPTLPIAIVEAEKSAVIASICKGVFPDMVWLACGAGGGWLNVERLRRIGRDRAIVLYPDADAKGYWFEKWQGIALDARTIGLTGMYPT